MIEPETFLEHPETVYLDVSYRYLGEHSSVDRDMFMLKLSMSPLSADH